MISIGLGRVVADALAAYALGAHHQVRNSTHL